jgi:hypothetical protein
MPRGLVNVRAAVVAAREFSVWLVKANAPRAVSWWGHRVCQTTPEGMGALSLPFWEGQAGAMGRGASPLPWGRGAFTLRNGILPYARQSRRDQTEEKAMRKPRLTETDRLRIEKGLRNREILSIILPKRGSYLD